MGDPIEVILEFLRRHRFTKAEAALKAELCARLEAHGPLPPSLSDDLDRDLTMQLLSTPDNALSVEAEHGPLPRGSLSSTPELIVCQEQGLREEDSAFLPGRPRSTSEKHMYVEDEPQELQDQQTRHAPGNESRLQNIQNMQEQGQPYHPGSQLKAETPQRGQADFPVVKLIIEQKQVREDVAASQDMGFRVSLHCTSEMPDVGSLQGLQALNSRNVGIDSEEQAVLSPNGEMQDSDEFIRNVQAAGPQVKLVSKGRLPQDLSFKQSPDDGNYLSKRHLDPMFGENSGLQHNTKPYEMDGARWEEKSALLQFEKTTMPERVPMVVEPSQSCEISFQEPRERASSQSSVKGEECTKNGYVSNFTHQGFQKDSPLQTTLPVSLVYPSVFEGQRSVRPDKWDVKEKDIRVTSETAVGTPEVIDCSQKSNGGPMNLHYIKRETSETEVGTPEVIDCSQKSNRGPMNLHYIKRVEVEDLPCSNGSLRNTAGELPRLPPVRLHSLDKSLESSKEGSGAGTSTRSFDSAAFLSMGSTPEGIFGLGAFLDIPLGQDTIVTGMKRPNARPSVSQGIVEDTSEHLSGFATAGDGQSESAKENIDEYWDSDTYEDDDDPGYLRQPIEDEVWFLAHEIDYPSEDERARNLEEDNHRLCKEFDKLNDADPSFVEEESYFSGEEYYRSKRADSLVQSESEQLTYSNLYPLGDDNKIAGLRSHEGSEYSSHMMDSEELIMMKSDSVWNGVMGQNKLVEVEEIGCADDRTHDLYPPEGDDNYRHGSVRSGALGGSSDAADIGSEVRESLFGESSEGDAENFREQELPVYGPAQCRFDQASSLHDISSGKETRHVEVKSAPVRHFDDDDDEEHHRMILSYYGEPWCHKERRKEKQVLGRSTIEQGSLENNTVGSNYDEDANNKNEEDNDCLGFGGFSFPSPSSTGDLVASRAESGKSPWSTRDSTAPGEETDEYQSGVIGPDDTLAAWKRNSNESSPLISSRDENLPNLSLSNQSMLSAHSTDGFARIKAREGGFELQDVEQFRENTITAADDEDSASALEQIRMSGCQEDEYEIFDLRIIHRKNRTGFEEDKDFPVVINSVIAGRYHVTEYLGSAAFSKAIQAHDLFTGIDVCMKIIKNSKDFFDQSLDEIKLLKFINKHDPSDKYHTLRLYDYFYHREHLFIVCELLRANLYEFHKYNRESGGEVYFTMPRLQSISRQCLEALEFLHGLGLIHCDLKPENILVKSYSHCEIKVIDLGSSCFQTDHLCSYVQSRSYRAPEVILGLPYGQKIDIWSLGCILAELCTGNVLFQNDSLATLLARLVGILGPIDPEMLAKGCDTHKYFTKNHMLYERNQDSNQLEYLLPKKTSLRHRLPMGDEGFVEFVASLLQVNPANRPSAAEALKHPWLLYPYEPFSS